MKIKITALTEISVKAEFFMPFYKYILLYLFVPSYHFYKLFGGYRRGARRQYHTNIPRGNLHGKVYFYNVALT